MYSPEKIRADVATEAEDAPAPDYVGLLMRVMEAQSVSIRGLALKSGLSKTRLGSLMHRDACKRAQMTLAEFQTIVRALGLDLMQVILSIEIAPAFDEMQDERFSALIALLSTMCHGLPRGLLEAMDDLQGLDGTEIRPEWGRSLQSTVIKKMVTTLAFVLQRREQLAEELAR